MSNPMPTRIKLISWLEHCEAEKPEAPSIIPAALCSEAEFKAAMSEGDIRPCRNIREAYRPTEQGLRKMAEYIEREAA